MEAEDARYWNIYKLCEHMGWTWDEYQSNPAEFNTRCLAYYRTEMKAQQDKQSG